MATRVKICGLTRFRDAQAAVELGAHAVGFVLSDGPRHCPPEKVRLITERLSPFVCRIGVFTDEDPGTIRDLTAYCGLDRVQLHGEQAPSFCRNFIPRPIKAVSVRNEKTLSEALKYKGSIGAILLDSFSPGAKGGTGIPFDWTLAGGSRSMDIPVILAGGLSPANVSEAIQRVTPHAVDVSSGVETPPHCRNHSINVACVQERIIARGTDHKDHQENYRYHPVQ